MTIDFKLSLSEITQNKLGVGMTDFVQLLLKMTERFAVYKEDRLLDCDKEFAAMFGYTREEILTLRMSQLIIKWTFDFERGELDNYSDTSKQRIGIKKDGTFFALEIIDHAYNIQNQVQDMRVAIIRDISERIEHEKTLRQLAYFDTLTNLPNLNYFLNALEQKINQAKREHKEISVYFIKFGYFNEINDIFGYHFGDKLISNCGEKLKKYEGDQTFAARIHGDDFIILRCQSTRNNDTVNFAKKVISDFNDPIKIEGHEVYITVNIGISSFPSNGSDPKQLIRLAESALNSNKVEYRSNFNLFQTAFYQKSKNTLEIETDLREALKDNQLSLVYQPQKNLYTNTIVGMEALIRWNHPKRGNIPPMEFIPFAERTGLIIEIGDWVLKEACTQNKLWQEAGYEPFVVSVNLSAIQFQENDLVLKVENALEETGLSPHYLELEITESMAMTNEESILKKLHQLREIGVLISIDDFGTGYSSLKYLSVFPITKLKIDKIFMDEKHNRSIVKSIINMSHALDMKVIAEGVETEEQLKFLINERCDEIQGYYFSKPLLPSEVEKFIKNHR